MWKKVAALFAVHLFNSDLTLSISRFQKKKKTTHVQYKQLKSVSAFNIIT